MTDIATTLRIHDELLSTKPEGATHDEASCRLCTDWAMADSGLPVGIELDFADEKAPYGPVKYADPGYQEDKVKRYPVDTEPHARAAWTYIHVGKNAEPYSADQLAKIRVVIAAALKRFGLEAEQKEMQKNQKVESPAKKSDANSSKKSTKASDKSARDLIPEVAPEGGNTSMDTVTTEVHEALLAKAVDEAKSVWATEKAELTVQVETLTQSATDKDAEIASLKEVNTEVNGKLDTAEVALTAATEKATALEADIAAKDEEARLTALSTERAAQIRNLNLFPDELIDEKAARWAVLDELAWTERVEDWKAVSTASGSATTTPTETASAFTGTTDAPNGTVKPGSARRAVLGL